MSLKEMNRRTVLASILMAWAILSPLVGQAGAASSVNMPASAGNSPWLSRFNAADPADVTALQGFLSSQEGARTLALIPSLRAVERFNPRSRADRLVIGAMELPAGPMTPEKVDAAYRAAQGAVTEALRSRAKEVLASFASRQLGKREFLAAAQSLARTSNQFSIYNPPPSEEAAHVGRLASEISRGQAIAHARAVAAQLLASLNVPGDAAPGVVALSQDGLRPPLARLKPSHAGKDSALGVDISAMDTSVRPQNDFFRYVNGTWLRTFEMPADKSRFCVFDELNDQAEASVERIIAEAAAAKNGSDDNQRIADFYRSFMDVDAVQARGLKPIAKDLERVQRIKTKRALAGLFAWALVQGIGTPIHLSVDQDSKNPKAYIAQLEQSGLGLPDRDYYFTEDQRSAGIRAKYVEYVAKLLALAGEKDARRKATVVFALEKSLAEHQWTLTQQRDVVKTYNKKRIRDLGALAKGFDWVGYLRMAKVRSQETNVIVIEPSYLTGFAKVLAEQPLENWKLYMKVRILNAFASYLPKAFEEAKFEYRGRVLRGTPEMEPRWKRGVQLVNAAVGEAVGRIYVKEHFPESSKERMKRLIENLRAAYAERIRSRPWMSQTTKKKALAKLRKFTPKIGYPDRWIDYSKLRVKADDLLGNVRRSNAFDYNRMIEKLGEPIDRLEWGPTPQTVNAYYNASMNEIIFPAAILQAPFFNPAADDAVNYGAIGAVIGHEMSHGFDDQGSEYDGDGRLRNWWTAKDKAEFKARAHELVRQFDAFEPLPGQHIKGELTLGENIGDLGGLTIAFHAYRLSLEGAAAPVIGGFTGAQRVFLGWAQVWRNKMRPEALAQQLATDPHSPAEYRVNGVVRNMPEFHRTFGLKEGDGLFLPENQRIGIW